MLIGKRKEKKIKRIKIEVMQLQKAKALQMKIIANPGRFSLIFNKFVYLPCYKSSPSKSKKTKSFKFTTKSKEKREKSREKENIEKKKDRDKKTDKKQEKEKSKKIKQATEEYIDIAGA